MMKSKFTGLLLCLAVLMLATSVKADTIVDTGYNGTYFDYNNINYNGLTHFSWHAGEFTILEDKVITSVEGYMSDIGTGTKKLTASIYSDGGLLPGARLFSSQFTVGSSPLDKHYDWFGAYGLDWTLTAGTYWVAFEVLTNNGDDYWGYMAPAALEPLENEAFYYSGGSVPGWYDHAYRNAYRINGTSTQTPVPEPSTLLLLGGGLAGLAGIGMKRRKH